MKEFIICCIGVLIFIIGMACFEGWIISLLWNWLVPMFWTGAPILTIWQAIGVMILLNIVGRLIFGSKTN